MTNPAEAFNIACAERGIASAEDFRGRFGVPLSSLSIEDALVLVTLPEWVFAVWLPSADPTPCVFVPSAVREFGLLLGVTQQDGETDHDFNLRVKAAFKEGRAA
jgi:hypothetical protein